ncbi:hypothetical protein FNF27_06900 [Cafeteria roenbergensis]|uniref:Uncharacterized protein n=2 Tax=Cafeteria roenbergensis TaxID=33653 RepID=A0A5A8C7M4_CAFRO|nr:hypothetical protein FNF29_06440 [Cafeteria roenbergensis]KAA0159156.1 hypothetical protein FNF31_05011 [Cafeteria roenbergensis]KAA0159741.1 hypothetical protein FNF28_05748 [Cafeteria roenbergensis]KAA0169605.1 hypothetical protein FNF27_06900 [Cafeteria roenbergensis]|eukprot:KAA0148815.1 hypothetical protein FNF29_06440 [Cafeteria roenbergensis]
MGCAASSSAGEQGSGKYAVESDSGAKPAASSQPAADPAQPPKAAGEYTDLGVFAVDTTEPSAVDDKPKDAAVEALERYSKQGADAQAAAKKKRRRGGGGVVVSDGVTMQAGCMQSGGMHSGADGVDDDFANLP